MNSAHAALIVSLTSISLISAQEVPTASIPQPPVLSIPGLRKLEITGQARLRFEDRLNFDLNRDVGDDDDFFTQRTRLNFDLEFNDDLSGFFQLQDFRRWGEEMSTTDGSADGFDLHQGWIQLENTPGIGGRTRVGRQAIAFGDQRLIGSLEWASQGRAFDGALQTWHDAGEYHRLHALFLQVGDAGASTMHEDAFLAGLYYTLLGIDDGELDFYALLLDDEETIAGGNHDRVTLGSRWDQRFGDMQFGAELATQVGQMDGADIPFGETFAAHAHATLHIEDSSLWVRGEVNLASGDDPSTTDNERFNTLFPTAHAHLGIMDFALWENLFHGMAQVGFDCCESSSLTASWSFFRSMEETDAFRGPGGRTLSAGGVGFSNTMGNEIDLVFTRRFDTAPAKTSIQIGYGLFLPGAGAVDANGNDDLAHFAYVQGDLRF